jgi:NAD(P)-dependent dehydrogenase (short-subunit alcohol dehydrogenase family)/SAM-dependent methyltransferase/acyl carrier protein
VLSAFPEAAAELALLERCGPKLADVFAGRADPLDLLFPEGDTALAEALYERSPFSAAVQRMAGAVASSMPRDHPLRVIETGGGTGATTAHVHGALPAGSSYLFTDIGAALVARAQERFAGKDIETARFDVERPPSAQDISAGGFDMAVAANVLHATRDLAGTLANVRDLLAPGGLLMMVENTGQFLWGDITFGLTPGMWAFQESEDRRHALLPQQQWRRYLAEAGFDCLEIADPGHAGLTGISQQCLILARRRPGRRIGIIGNGYEKFSRLLKERGHDLVPLVEGEDFLAGMTDLVYFEGGATGRPAEEILTSVHRAVRQAAAGTAVPRITLIGHGGEDTAVLAGFGRGVAVELPDTLCRVIEADPVISVADQGAGLASAFLETDGDIRLSKGAAGALQLTPEPMTAHNVPELDPNGSYLVTGAFGGLGPHLVRWLQKRGARRFVLAGRREPSPAVRSALAGIDVQFEIADIGDPAAVRKLVDAATAIAPLKGIFHATGALADGALINQTEEDMVVPLRSKLAGAQALDRATREIALDHFVLFSSAAGLLAPFGQANHAAANTALDALAIRRRAEGLPALSVDWGAFAEAGAAMQPGIEEKVSETGLGFMPPEAAFDALGHAMTLDMAQVAIIDADWRRYSKRYPAGGIPFLLQNVCEGRSDAPRIAKAETAAPASARREWRTVLGDAPASHRFDRLCDLIRCEAAAILRVPEGALDEDKPLREAGLDSLMSIELRNTLSNAVSSRLGATLVFDHPSLRALAGHLGETAFPDLFDAASRRRNGVNPETREEDEPDLDSLDAESLSALLAAELGEQARRG